MLQNTLNFLYYSNFVKFIVKMILEFDSKSWIYCLIKTNFSRIHKRVWFVYIIFLFSFICLYYSLLLDFYWLFNSIIELKPQELGEGIFLSLLWGNIFNKIMTSIILKLFLDNELQYRWIFQNYFFFGLTQFHFFCSYINIME